VQIADGGSQLVGVADESDTSSAEVSKLTTIALSRLVRMTLSMNWPAASCSNLKRSRMLLAGVDQNARRRGRSDSAAKSEMVCRRLPSTISKSFLSRSVMKRPFLSVTVNSRLTRVTSTWMRVGSSL